jgi:hypothetical protein
VPMSLPTAFRVQQSEHEGTKENDTEKPVTAIHAEANNSVKENLELQAGNHESMAADTTINSSRVNMMIAEANGHPESPLASPIRMDTANQDQGKDLQELLRLFKHAISEPLFSFILQTHQHKNKTTAEQQDKQKEKQGKYTRLQEKTHDGKTVLKKLVAKKCGIMEEDQEMDNMTLQQYLNMYKQPLTEEYVEAIRKLADIAEKKKKKKKNKKKKVDEARGKEAEMAGKKKSKKGSKTSLAPADGVKA